MQMSSADDSDDGGLRLARSAVANSKSIADHSRQIARAVAGSIRQADTRAKLLAPLSAERAAVEQLYADVRAVSGTILAIGDLLTMVEAEATRHEVARRRGALLADVLQAAKTAAVANSLKSALKQQLSAAAS